MTVISTPTLSSGINWQHRPWLGVANFYSARIMPNDWRYMRTLLWMHERNQRVIMIHEADGDFS